ncbi:MAG: zinc metalloprotease HtpX [Epsilonproteobacteria bacterium]|nr:zinc metalloprotease HtpX [Campylobacterota bacterium]
MEVAKTAFLLTALTLLFIWIGGMLGGQTGMLIAFIVAIGMNFFSYYNSDKLVLKHYNAVEVNEQQAAGLYDMVRRLADKAGTPMPKVYIIPDHVPNAFATGRNHSNAAVAVTEGLLEILNDNEVEGVLAHEMSHVKHYDILVGTVAATIAGAIAMIANFGMMFGGGSSENRPNPIIMIALMFLAPMAASIVQMAVSRNREFMADEGAARLTGHPEWLQSALAKLDNYSRGHQVMDEATPATAHMFIINPFSGKDISFKSLFSTHPKTEDRIARLEELKAVI